MYRFSRTEFSVEILLYFNCSEGVPISNCRVPDSNQPRENSLEELI